MLHFDQGLDMLALVGIKTTTYRVESTFTNHSTTMFSVITFLNSVVSP